MLFLISPEGIWVISFWGKTQSKFKIYFSQIRTMERAVGGTRGHTLKAFLHSSRPHLNLFWKVKIQFQGSGCGSVGRAVTFDTRGPRFDSSHRQNFIEHLFIINCIEKTKINKKRPGMAHFLKKNSISRNSFPSIFHQRWPSWLIGQIVHTGLQFESHQLMC